MILEDRYAVHTRFEEFLDKRESTLELLPPSTHLINCRFEIVLLVRIRTRCDHVLPHRWRDQQRSKHAVEKIESINAAERHKRTGI